ncbi:MAG: Fe-S cluster assembly protein SufD [Candidatus Krumholzibacteriia bacterium]
MANTTMTDLANAVIPAPRTEFTDAALDAFSRRLGEDPAGAAWRRAAAAVNRTIGFPDRVRHLWRYTDPADLLPGRALLQATESPERTELPATPAVLLRPGHEPLVNAAAAAVGVTAEALFGEADHAQLVGRAVAADHGYFESLNAAAFDAGVVVRVPRDHVAAAPLRLVIAAVPGRDVLPRVLVAVGAGASVTVVEDHLGGGAGAVVVGVTEILVGANADVHHVLVQRWEDGTVGHLTVRARIERDGRYLGASAGFGGDVAKFDLGAILAGEGARSELVGVTLPDRRQHLDHHTMHRHLSGHTWSNIDFKAAVAGRARSSYTGLLRIEKDAPGSEAYQENRNLLLSEKARADTIPELEILTDDVSCSHGATAAPLDPEQLFYLQSRGIPADESLRLVVRGFVELTLRQVPEGLRADLEALVDARLERLVGER